MHHAPSVLYPVGRSCFLGRWVPLLWVLGALAAVGQAWQTGGLTVPVLLTGGSVLLAGVMAWWYVQHTPTGALRWDGEAWFWVPQSLAADAFAEPLVAPPQVHLDLQHVLLLGLRLPGQRPCWLWLEKPQSPARWDDLRRAVFAERQALPEPDSAAWPEKGLL